MESLSATSTEIQSFKEKNEAMFQQIMELNAMVQREYDALVKIQSR